MADPVIAGGLAEAVTNILLGGGALAALVWAAYQQWQNNKLKSANNEAGVSVAVAQETVFNLVTSQLESLRREVEAVRNELNEERKHSRVLQAHIYKLEATMRNHNIDPPIFEASLVPGTPS